MWGRIKFLIDQLGTLQTLHSLLSAPAVLAMLTALSGYLGNVPTMWIIFAATGVFAFTAHGLLRGSEFSHRMRVDGKLDFVNPQLTLECDWGDDGKPIRVARINLGIQLINRAYFPLKYTIKSLNSVVEGRAAVSEAIENKNMTIAASTVSATVPDRISIADLNKLDLKGRLDFEVHYGRFTAGPYVIKRRLEVDVFVSADGSVRPNPTAGIAVRDRP